MSFYETILIDGIFPPFFLFFLIIFNITDVEKEVCELEDYFGEMLGSNSRHFSYTYALMDPAFPREWVARNTSKIELLLFNALSNRIFQVMKKSMNLDPEK